MWTMPAILGLILGIVGAVGALGVIELRPQLNVTPQGQLAPGQPFTAPFQLTNTGYLSTHIENVIMLYPIVELPGDNKIFDAAMGNVEWDNFDVDRGESKTIVANFTNGMPTKAEIVLGVDYDFLWMKWRWFFRFEGVHMDNWQWSRQPIGKDREQTLNRAMNNALLQHQHANQRH
ncbi:MAG TPA: hypothetical protein VKR82_15840 [Candidatus Acidoferrales bacterium]|nr:hypothetical protein [Candidatus Acidoferrales bacterium]